MRLTMTRSAALLALMTLIACTPASVTTQARKPSGQAATTAGATPAPEPIDTKLSPRQVTAARSITAAPPPKMAARSSAAQLDTTTAAQKTAAASPPPVTEVKLGQTIASLGNPAEGGFWIKTPLVSQPGIGRIVNPLTGKSARVDLIPLAGPASGGSQVSLPALRLIGVSLTDLPMIEVYKS